MTYKHPERSRLGKPFVVAYTDPFLAFALRDPRFIPRLLENILNARAELAYLRHAVKFLGEEPCFLFLPTAFINNYRQLFSRPNTQYTLNIVNLPERIRSGDIRMFDFIAWITSHYSRVYKCSFADLEHGDSLHLPLASDLLPILRSVFPDFPGARSTLAVKPKQELWIANHRWLAEAAVASHVLLNERELKFTIIYEHSNGAFGLLE
ncbi:hypothetical protein DFH09DRAFT_1108265 [Mycena vulgaris]|nr:hypothetical protein DFH09DRAFT_1108265 [Mycena vulgaris]